MSMSDEARLVFEIMDAKNRVEPRKVQTYHESNFGKTWLLYNYEFLISLEFDMSKAVTQMPDADLERLCEQILAKKGE